MEQTNKKNVKRYIEQAHKDFKTWLKNSNDNKRKIICATLLHIQELTHILTHYNLEGEQLNNIEKSIENALNNISTITAHV